MTSNGYLWKGVIRITGYHNALTIPCIAVPYNTASHGSSPICNASSWPRELHCESLKVKRASQFGGQLGQSHFYVRFIPVDARGMEVDEPRLGSISAVLMERGLVFDVKCHESSNRGTLYLWSIHNRLGLYSLIGGFKADVPT